jgi:proton-dependent oligopeptide transporter, POT family
VILGAALMAVGHFMMAFEPLFLPALITLILSNGAFKPNISTQVGGLYAPGDHRRDRAYSIFYVGINLGRSSHRSSAARSVRRWAGIMGSPLPASG